MLAASLVALCAPDGLSQPPFSPPGGQERKLVKESDKNKDGWLNADEREAARGAVKNDGAGSKGGFGRGMGQGMNYRALAEQRRAYLLSIRRRRPCREDELGRRPLQPALQWRGRAHRAPGRPRGGGAALSGASQRSLRKSARRAAGSAGLVRCSSKPESRAFCLSASWP